MQDTRAGDVRTDFNHKIQFKLKWHLNDGKPLAKHPWKSPTRVS